MCARACVSVCVCVCVCEGGGEFDLLLSGCRTRRLLASAGVCNETQLSRKAEALLYPSALPTRSVIERD